MTLARAFLQHCALNALSVVANAQPEETGIVCDLDFDTAGLRVPERVSKDLSRDPVDVAVNHWRQPLRPALYSDLERRIVVPGAGSLRKRASCNREQVFEAALQGRIDPQSLNRLSTLGDGLTSLTDRIIERADRFLARSGSMLRAAWNKIKTP